MASPQSSDDIEAICERLQGQRITLLQVLGINSLKSLQPGPDDVVGDVVEGAEISDRILAIHTDAHTITIDLQRTGKLVWLTPPEPYRMAPGSMPTVRLITDGGGLDLSEPAKTKRITVAITGRSN